jgi:hypothetical protein
VLSELVGYTKHAQSLLRNKHDNMSYCPLTEMRKLTDAEAVKLREQVEHCTRTRQDVTVMWLKDTLFDNGGVVAEPEPGPAPAESSTAVLLTRLHSFIQ